MKDNRPVALIDICGTLFASNTTMDFLDYTFQSKKLYRIYRQASKMYVVRGINKILLEFFSCDLIRAAGILFLRGKSEKAIAGKVNDFYDHFLQEKARPEIFRLVNDLRENYKLVLASATLDCVARKVAGKLAVSAYVSSELAYANGICLGKLKNDLLHRKKDGLKKKHIFPPFGMVVSDNTTDACLMKMSHSCYIISHAATIQYWESIIQKEQLKVIRIIPV